MPTTAVAQVHVRHTVGALRLVALPDAAHFIAGARESFRSFVDGALTQDPLSAAFEEVLDQTMSLFFGQIVSGHLLASTSSGWHR